MGAIGLDLDYWRARLLDVGSSTLNQDCNNGDLLALGVALLCKNKKEGGSARALPVAAPMPKSVTSKKKRACLEGGCSCV